MPTLSGGDLTTIRKHPFVVKKYLTVAPRESVYTAQVNGSPAADSVSGGYISIPYDNGTGTLGDVKVGMSLDVGTSPGARDIGTVFIRKAPTSNTFYIPETNPGKLPVLDNHYLTVVNEHRPHQKLPRLVATTTGNASYANTFVEYHNYDETYSNQNSHIEPKANITENGLNPAKPAGWVDVGQTYRTVVLDSSLSFAIATGASISSRSWNVADGTITVGTSSSTAITVTFPKTKVFRYISLTVTDSLSATHTMYFPIWVFSEDNPPLGWGTNTEGFVIRKDERGDGREMTFEIFGEIGGADTTVIPEGAVVCYWEEATFDGDAAPDQYISSFLGWVTHDVSTLKIDADTYLIDVSGLQFWLDKFNSFAQTVSDTGSTPNKWYYMEDITEDRLCHYALRSYTDVLRLGNLYLSDNTTIMKEEEIKKGSPWSQLVDLLGAGKMHRPGVDSLNGIWFRPDYSYLELSDRGSIANVVDLDPDDWTYDSTFAVGENKLDNVAIVSGTGSSWGGSGPSAVFYSRAPGSVPGDVAGDESTPFYRVDASGAQDSVNKLTGHHYAKINNRKEEITITLVGNYDIIEPAWRETITLTWLETTVRNTVLSSELFEVKKVSVTHSEELGQPSKKINWTLGWLTIGDPGSTYIPPASQAPLSLPVTETSPIYGTGGSSFPSSSVGNPNIPSNNPGNQVLPGRAAIRNTDTKVYYTLDITQPTPTWVDVTPASFFTDIKMVVGDRSSAYSKGAYVLGNDGTDSKIAYTANIYTASPTWSYGGVMTGIYTSIDNLGLLAQIGSVNAYCAGGGSAATTVSDDLTSGLASGSHEVDAVNYPMAFLNGTSASFNGSYGGSFIATGGRGGGGCIEGYDCGTVGLAHVINACLVIDLGAEHTIVSASLWAKLNAGDYSSGFFGWAFYDSSKAFITWWGDNENLLDMVGTYANRTRTGSQSGVRYISAFIEHNPRTPNPPYLDDVSVTWDDGGGGGGGSAIVAHSNNYGSTLDYITVGTSPTTGEAAFAGSKSGIKTVAAADGALMLATTEDGAYSAEADGDTTGTYAICARIPWYKIGSITTLNATDTPDYYMASAVAITGETLWKIVSGTKTDITPTVGGTEAIGVGSNCIGTWKGKRIIFIGDVSGTLYIFRSVDAGATWNYVAMPLGISVRARRQSTNGLEWLAAAGTNGLYWTDNGGTTWQNRVAAGDNRFAELFG